MILIRIREALSEGEPNFLSRGCNAVNTAAGITVLRTRP